MGTDGRCKQRQGGKGCSYFCSVLARIIIPGWFVRGDFDRMQIDALAGINEIVFCKRILGREFTENLSKTKAYIRLRRDTAG